MRDLNHPTLRKFNPGTFQSDAEVIEQFVVREHELAIVLDILRANIDADSCQHTLIVAPRGEGKTMLLTRIAAELHTHSELSTCLLPVRFMEESHEVLSSADFWLDVLFYLARAAGTGNPGLGRELRATHADLSSRWRERELDERARTAVLEVADRLGKRLVLMVENLQALCGNVDEDFGWKLRKTLQTEPQIILLATATGTFTALDDAREPFFELFRIISLQPLDTMQCGRLWQAVSGDAVSECQIRPLEILTGGSPRLLVIVAGFARHRSIRRLMEQLVRLIDDHTEYFRGNLEVLAKTERRVFLAVADLWQPSSTGEIAARARLDVRTVSTMLGRLVERGAVIAYGTGRKRQYAVAQRLYCLYYKLRRERDQAAIVQDLIRFMTVFYGEDESDEFFGPLRRDALQSPDILAGLERAQAEMPQLSELTDELARGAQTALDAAIEHIDRADYDAAVALCDELIGRFGASESPHLQIAAMRAFSRKGLAQGRAGDRPGEIATNREALARFGTSNAPELQYHIGISLFNVGVAQIRLGDHKGGLATCAEMVRRFATTEDSQLCVLVARCLINEGWLHGQLGDRRAELAAYRQVIDQYAASDAAELQVQVATALFNAGVALARNGNHTAAIAACAELVQRFGASDVPELQSRVARALVNQGVEQEELGEHARAVTTWEGVVERYADSADTELQASVAQALAYTAVVHDRLGQIDAALSVTGEVVRRFGESDDPGIKVHVAGALVQRGASLGGGGRHDEAIAANDEMVEHFGQCDDEDLLELSARALNNKSVSQELRGDTTAALETCDAIVCRFRSHTSAELGVQVATALFRRGMLLAGSGRADEALASADELERSYGTITVGSGAAFTWQAAYVRMCAFLAQGRRDEASGAFCSMYATISPESNTTLSTLVEAVIRLVAAAMPERELIAILRSEPRNAGPLAPLIIALRQRAGETVRSPAEVLEVAADVRKRLDAGIDSPARPYPRDAGRTYPRVYVEREVFQYPR